jgi:hypothetical protein
LARLLRGLFPDQYDGDLFTLPDGSPRLWWIDPSIWAERHHPDTVNREEVEDEALKRLFKQARALTRFKRWRNVLTGLERKAVSLELDYMREYRQPPAVTPETPTEKRTLVSVAWGDYYKHKWTWIAQRMGRGFTSLQVRSLLDEASRVLMDAESMRDEAVVEMVYARKMRQYDRIDHALEAMGKHEFRGLVRECIRDKGLSDAA